MQKWNSYHSQSLIDKLSINGDLDTSINHEVYSAFIPKEKHQSTICQHGFGGGFTTSLTWWEFELNKFFLILIFSE